MRFWTNGYTTGMLVIMCVLLVSCTSAPDETNATLITIPQLTLASQNEYSIITRVAFSPDGQILAVGTNVGKVILWKANDGALLQSIQAYRCCRVYDIAFSPTGDLIAAGIPHDRVLVWQVKDGTLVQTLTGGTFVGSGVRNMTSIAYSPDGETIAAGAYDGSILLWQAKDGSLLYREMGNEFSSSIFSLAFSPDGKLLAIAKEKAVLLLEVEGWRPLDTVYGSQSGTALAVAFSPDSRTLAIGRTGGTIEIINVDDGSVAHVFSMGWRNAVWSLAFSPDGESLATGTRDGKIRIWQVRSERLLYVIKVAPGEPAVAFSPDGKMLATGADDSSVQIWTIQ